MFAKLKRFSPESEILSEKSKKKNLFGEGFDQFRSLEVREKARNVFVMSLRLSSVLKQATVDNLPVGVRWVSGLI